MNENGIRTTKTIIRVLTAASFLLFTAYTLFLMTKVTTGRAGRIIGIIIFSMITIASFLALAHSSNVKVVRIILLTVGIAANTLMKMTNIPVIFGALDFSDPPTVLSCVVFILSQAASLILIAYYLIIRRNQSISLKAKRVVTVIMLTIVIAFFAISMIMECVMYLKYNYNIVWRVDGTVLSRVLHYLGFIGIAVGFILPSTTVEEDEIEEYVNKEQADADIMVISPENQKPRAEEERRRNLVIDNADIVMSSTENKKPRAEEERRRNLVIDNADIIMGSTENKKPRAEEERRRNRVIDSADIIMGSPETKKSRSNKNKPRKSVLDDNDFVFSTPENTKSSQKHKK